MNGWNFNPHNQGQSPGFNRRGSNNYRGNFNNRPYSDLSVNDEVVGGGGRKAPPAHTGSNYSNYPHPTNFPPQAHGNYPGFPGFGGYGGYGGYPGWQPDFHPGYHTTPPQDRRQGHHRNSEEERQGQRRSSDDRSQGHHRESEGEQYKKQEEGDYYGKIEEGGNPRKYEEEKNQGRHRRNEEGGQANQRSKEDKYSSSARFEDHTTPERSSSNKKETEAKSLLKESPNKDKIDNISKKESESSAVKSPSKDSSLDLMPPGGSAAIVYNPPYTSPPAAHAHNRRKQYTPQKVPVGPGGSSGTMSIITQKGLILEDGPPDPSSKTLPSPSSTAVQQNREESPKYNKEDKKETLEVLSDKVKSNVPILESISPPQPVEEKPTKTTPNKTRRSHGRSEPTPPSKSSQPSPTSETTLLKLSQPTRAESSKESQKKQDDKEEKIENPALPKLRGEDTPQRRRSKGEMKAFPSQEVKTLQKEVAERAKKEANEKAKKEAAERAKIEAAERSKKEAAELAKRESVSSPEKSTKDVPKQSKEDSVETTKKADKKSGKKREPSASASSKKAKETISPSPSKSRGESSGSTPSPTKRSKEMFRKVEEDLEAMFAGIGSPEDNKPKESDQSSSLSPAPSQPEQMSQGSNHIPQASTDKAISQPMLEPEVKSARSKRKSAQTAELKIRENQSEDYSMYQPRFKAPRESPKATRLPKESAKLKESPKPSSSQAPKLKESPKSASSKGSKLEKSPKPKLQDSPKPLNSNVPKLEEKSKPSSSKPPRLEESPKTSSSSGDSSKKSKTSSKNEPEETMKAAREINDAAENAKETIKIDKDAKSTEDVETPKPSPRPRRRTSIPVKEEVSKNKMEPILFVDETAVADEVVSSDQEQLTSSLHGPASLETSRQEVAVTEELKSPGSGRRSRRSRGSVADILSPVKDEVETKEEVAPTEGRSKRKRTLSIDVGESSTSGLKNESITTPAAKSPTKKSKRLNSTQELDMSKIGLLQTVDPPPLLSPVRTSLRGKENLNQDSSDLNKEKTSEKPDSSAKKSHKKLKGKEEKGKKGKKVSEEIPPDAKGKKNSKGRPEWKGPYVLLEGDFRSPRTVNVVNSTNNENKQKAKRGLIESEFKAKSSNYGYSSTLSKQYDFKTVDDTWRCVFCNQKSHFKRLGDLFGPYFVPTHCLTPEEEEKRPKSKRRSLIAEAESGSSEIWFHEDCFCWIPGVHLVGSRIVGMEEGVSVCRSTRCITCNELGASLGCTMPGCRVATHVPCSYQQAWVTDMHNFKATCPRCCQQ